jgi:hypothetical protein
MADNRQIKDGIGNLFTIRMRDISPNKDGTEQRSMILATPYSADYGSGGIFQYVAKSTVMNAGMAASSPIISFRWPGPSNFVSLRRIRLIAWTNTIFAGGIATFDVFAARGYTAQATGGTQANLSPQTNMLRTSMSPSSADLVYSTADALIPGTRTLDLAPLDSRTVSVGQSANTIWSNMPATIFEKIQGEHPLLLGSQEGCIVQATVPSDGNWCYSATIEWDEIPTY